MSLAMEHCWHSTATDHVNKLHSRD